MLGKMIVGFPVLLLVVNCTIGQKDTSRMPDVNVPYVAANNPAYPCITPAEYAILERQCADNLLRLGFKSSPLAGSNTLATSLHWPVKLANGLPDCGYYFIGAYVDQDKTTNSVKDFNCGTKTYDGHQGTDISAWPYAFYKMDNNQVEVVAAAAGIIIQKADGNFDRNCNSNALTANSIIIQHADGSYALYWHLKKNSVTAKAVGQSVVAGEYLGIVGSSGSSSGPHLHFELWTGNNSSTYKDPYAGPCNLLNANSWWEAQRPHIDPAILKVSANTTDMVLPGCPNTEIPNESHGFTVPYQGAGLAPGYAKFYIFLRDAAAGTSADLRILNPNGSTFNSWVQNLTTIYNASYYGYSRLLPTIPGIYTFQATYNGTSCTWQFQIAAIGAPATYTFTGNGNWNVASNWFNNNMPPATLSNGEQIVIDPAADGECILNVTQTISSTCGFTVMPGKKVRLLGNLIRL
jgi:hypothetical protein